VTDAIALALIVAVPPTLVALSGLIVSIRNGKKADVIKEHVNSTATKQQEKIDNLTTQVESLLAVQAERKEIASLLAQAAADRTSVTAIPVEIVSVPDKLKGDSL
jgi:ABC-type uncharacterized transport system ATPase subunit